MEPFDFVQSDHERAVNAAILQMVRRMEDTSLTSEKLATAASYSPFHFDRIFRSVTGIPPRLFLAALRFQKSKRLLQKSSLSATEVGLAVGYSSFGTFSAKFAQYIGLSPQQFRQHIEGKMIGLSDLRSIGLPEQHSGSSTLKGTVAAPGHFRGIVCVGLFPKPIPIGTPVACTMMLDAGAYSIPDVPDGSYSILSIAFSWEDSPEEYLHPKHALRGKASGKITVQNGRVNGDTFVQLRPPRFYDPPILVSLPVLIQAYVDKLEGIREQTGRSVR